MVTYITAQYSRVYGDCKEVSQSFHGGDHSGCIESVKQPSPMEKSSRMPLYYKITVHVTL